MKTLRDFLEYDMVKETILNTIKKYDLIGEEMHIVLGLSGGPDSVCLFHVLMSLAPELGLTLHPVHVNHQIRPGDAEHDQKYVEDLCARLGLTCRTVVFDCNKMAADEGMTSEEAGRAVRYGAFHEEARALEKGGVPKNMIRIAVAHNADDQVETVLFRLLRGTGPDGMAGMDHYRVDEEGYGLIRPLLDVWKADVLDYCTENQLDPCIDYTNSQAIYSRNRIRLELIPYLQGYNPNIKEAVLRLSSVASVDKDYLTSQAREALAVAVRSRNDKEVIMDGQRLQALGTPVRRRVIALAFKEIGLVEDLTYAHFTDSDKIIFSDRPSARLDLPHGYYLTKVYDDVKAAREVAWAGPSCRMTTVTKADFLGMNLTKGSFAAFDADALGGGVVWRTRQEGDRIAIKGGSKKLQDLFVDLKIPKDRRDTIWFAAKGREVLFIPAVEGLLDRGRYSADYCINSSTKNLFLIEIVS